MDMNDSSSTSNHQAVIQVAKALSNPLRVRMVFLASKTITMPQSFERILGISQPQVSKHLKILRDSGIFKMERVGSVSIYRIDLEHGEAIQKLIEAGSK
jgi:DNA-binding transcriptional ArsR family regulator